MNAGRIIGVAGPVVRAAGMRDVAIGEVVRVGPHGLLGEVIHLDADVATVQVYEETAGLSLDDPVAPTRAPIVAWLGPGLLGATLDGLQRPLDRMARAGRWLLLPGARGDEPRGERPSEDAEASGEGDGEASGGGEASGDDVASGDGGEASGDDVASGDGGVHAALDTTRRWEFTPARVPGEEVGPGDVVGHVAEGPVRHGILVPPSVGRGVLSALVAGDVSVVDEIGRVRHADGTETPLHLAHPWPIRVARPVARRLPVDRPLLTGMRVVDMLFPVALGGTAVIPGGFGTGKTVVEQSLARWSDADVVVYVGCGERGNEMAELLSTFPTLIDPRTGGPLAARTVLIANTSNMPVAAREASVQLGMTIAEYFRDQGLHVALLADSTSRWAEALREISGRLEELPGEEGYPAYLASRLAALYERSGHAVAAGSPERRGSVTLVGAVSPPGGDFSEPVTQASLRLAGTFWALDATLAHARHFPAISWTQSYSLYVDALAPSLSAATGGPWRERRAEAIELLARERVLAGIVSLVGADALPDTDRITLEVARLLRETFLAQHAFDPVDASRPPDVQFALLEAVLASRAGLERAIAEGATLASALATPELDELRRARQWPGDGLVARLRDLAGRVRELRPPPEPGIGEALEPGSEPTWPPVADRMTESPPGPPTAEVVA